MVLGGEEENFDGENINEIVHVVPVQ